MSFNSAQPSFIRLRDHYAERRRPIVFWVGAGLSTDAGLPTWAALREKIINQSIEMISTWEPKAAREAEHKLQIAAAEDNLWNSFQIIKDTVRDTEFRESIKEIFKNSTDQPVPDMYQVLWTMKNIDGMLSLNIDNFAGRSHRIVRASEDILSFSARDAKDYVSAISNGRRFIANLHGQKDAYSSWVFTRNEIDALVRSEAYASFINYVFSAMTVIFVGISADDVAAGGFLERLTAYGLDVGPHFWITNRVDKESESWSSRAGVQIVRYQPELDVKGKISHATALAGIFHNIHKYVSRDKDANVVVSAPSTLENIPSVRELRQKDDDEIRSVLAAYARNILEKNSNNTNSSEYKSFLKNYSPCIHQAWHITDEEPYNDFLGFKVVEKISNSTFSNVWRLVDDKSNNYALKIIQMDNLHAGPQISSFRRGVESLRYLSNADVPGTARLTRAQEIPSSVIMEFIEGQNLSDISSLRDFHFWREGLEIINNICKHLEFSHNLPQSVLHRDIRPSNVMIPNYHWSDTEAVDHGIDRFKAVLLNYDMSWHINAKGHTIAGNLEEAGFYAPELLENSFGSVARRTSVDCYGLGMTIFYMYCKQTPPSGGSKSTDWLNILSQKFRTDSKVVWRSAPERLRRIILNATNPNDEERISIKAIKDRISSLYNAVKGNYDTVTVDIWAEELLSNAIKFEYQTDANENSFSRTLKTGRVISARGDFARKRVEVNFSNIATEATDRVRAVKSWGDKLKSAQDVLKSGGWTIGSQTTSRGLNIILSASISIDDLRVDFHKKVNVLMKGIDQVRLD